MNLVKRGITNRITIENDVLLCNHARALSGQCGMCVTQYHCQVRVNTQECIFTEYTLFKPKTLINIY